MKRSILIFTTALLLCSANAVAQDNNDFGADLSVEVEKKIKPGLSVEAGIGFRSQDDSKDMERFTVSVGVGYRLYQTKDKKFNIKSSLGAEYFLMQKLSECKEHFNSSNVMNGYNQAARYKQHRLRGSLGIAFNYKPSKRWTFSLKETFQYNHYFSADSVSRNKYRYNDDDELYLRETDKKYIEAKDRLILRNKFTVEYNIKGLPLNPFVSADLGVGLNKNLLKQKYTAGMDYNINKQHRLSVWYRFAHENDDDEPNGHLVGWSYKYEF